MKTIPVGLLFTLLAAASAAASDLSFTLGYGSARLDGGQASRVTLLPKNVEGSVNVLRLSLDYDLTSRIGIEGSYLAFSDLVTVHAVDPGIMTTVAPNNRYRRELQAFAVGPTLALLSADPWTVKAGLGWVFSDSRTTLDGGGEGVQRFRSNGSSGYMGSLDISYAFTPHLAAGVSCRLVNFGTRVVSSDHLVSQQTDLFVALRF